MWLVVNAVYKKSKVSNSSSGMNKCASVTLRAKDVWLADLKAILYEDIAQLEEQLIFNQ